MAADDARGQTPLAHHEDLPGRQRRRPCRFSCPPLASLRWPRSGGTVLRLRHLGDQPRSQALQANFHIGNGLCLVFAPRSASDGRRGRGGLLPAELRTGLGRRAMMKLAAVLFCVCGLGAGLAAALWMSSSSTPSTASAIGCPQLRPRTYCPKSRTPRFRGRSRTSTEAARDRVRNLRRTGN